MGMGIFLKGVMEFMGWGLGIPGSGVRFEPDGATFPIFSSTNAIIKLLSFLYLGD
jgi:hypothetical protein